MTAKNRGQNDLAKRRRQAEKKARAETALSPEEIGVLSPEEIRQALHDLRVHQIELETQNEELRRAQVELDAARARYFDLYDLAPVGYCTFNEQELILDTNLTAAAMLSVSRGALVMQPITRFILKEDQDIYYLHRKQLFETGEPQACELRMLRRDGTEFWAHLEATAARDADGGTVCRMVMSDITERKRAEESFQHESAMRGMVIEHLPCLALILKKRTREIVYANQAAREGGAILGKTCYETCAERDKPCPFCLAPEVWDTNSHRNLEVEHQGRHYESQWSPLTDELYVHYIFDITERKKVEEELRQSEERFRTLFETIPGSVFVHRGDRYLDVNAAFTRTTGYTREELLDMPFWELVHPDFRDVVKDRGQARRQGTAPPSPYEARTLTKSGKERWVVIAASRVPFEGEAAVLGIVIDITDLKVAQAANERQRQLLLTLIEAMPDLIYVKDAESRFLLNNRAQLLLLGAANQEEAAGKTDADFFPPELAAKYRADEQAVLASGEPLLNREERAQDPRGNDLWLLTTKVPFRDSLGHVIGIVGIGRDITERKQAETALRESEAGLASAQRIGHIGSWQWDVRINAARWSNETYRIFGLVSGELEEHRERFLDAIHPEDRARVDQALTDALSGSKEYDLDYRIVLSDGTEKTIRARAEVLRSGDGKPIMMQGTVQDITARKIVEAEKEKLEAQLRQAQKMESVGRLAGGVAHDFNNLLQIILGNVDIMQGGIGKDRPSAEALDEVREAAQRAADLTRQLLAFSRRQIIQPVNLDLNDLLQGMLKMIRRVIGEHIEMFFMPGARLGTVHADRGQIEQVLMNLCVNARDSMAKGGTLTVETENVVIDDAYCHEHPWATEGRYVLLSVTDTGHGMDDATCAQIFEPFFTTKDVGQGTGLGLATVYGIVKHHNGLIHVYSEPGKGTAFKIYLPIVERPAEQVGTKIEGPIVGGSETILVAEDEKVLLNLVSRILAAAGYTVLSASDGEDALRVLDEHAGAIDMAILDVVMPKLGGRQVMDRIQAKYPRMRFLFSSGYSENAIHTDFVIKEGLRLITKPYRKEDLLRAVREILDAPSSI